MTTKIQKWGNSLALRIPKSYANSIEINAGTDVNIKIEDNKLIIFKEKKQKYSLKKLLSGINNNNIHKEHNFGNPTGKELI